MITGLVGVYIQCLGLLSGFNFMMSVVTFILVNDFHLTVEIPCYSEPNGFTSDTYFVLQIGNAHIFLRATFLPHPPSQFDLRDPFRYLRFLDSNESDIWKKHLLIVSRQSKKDCINQFSKSESSPFDRKDSFYYFFSSCLMNVRQEGLGKHLSKTVFYTEEDKPQLQRDPTETQSYRVTQKTRNILFGLLGLAFLVGAIY